MDGKKNHRKWSSGEKLRIVLAGLDGTIEISELCRREGINPTQYYGWKKQLTNSATDSRNLSSILVAQAGPSRPDRQEPRVKKRRPKQYPLMTKPRRQLKKDPCDK